MALEFIGCGDLHLDGKLIKYLPDLNSRIMDEVKKVLEHARRKGVTLIVLYGDICETPHMSTEATSLLIELFLENPNFNFIVLLGNHDVENSETHSLQVLSKLRSYGVMKNVSIVDKPRTFFAHTSRPLRCLPWPSLDTQANCLNVIHEAVSGSTWDHGRPVDGAKKVKHTCVAGHLHTSQVCGSVHFSGTLYQTSFGEKEKKYFHHVRWGRDQDKPEIKRIRHYPSFTLRNLVVNSKEDLAVIDEPRDSLVLFKVFVKSDVLLDADTFKNRPSVVKVNSFKTEVELRALVSEEIRIDEEFNDPSMMSVERTLDDWLKSSNIEPSLKKRAKKKFTELFSVGNVNSTP